MASGQLRRHRPRAGTETRAHKATIKANLARLLGLAESSVNVKAKTGEHVGPVGRGEAIVCHAVVLMAGLTES